MLKKIYGKLTHNIPFLALKQRKRVMPWEKANGDKTLRMDYDLNENSVVLDLGGFEGQWASDIFGRYVCDVHVFEPAIKYVENIRQRFKKNKKIRVYDFGLSGKDEVLKLFISGDRSSLYKKSGRTEEIKLRNAKTFLSEANITKIDLLKINIEGGEYDLLDHLIKENLIDNIGNIQIQFHDFVPNARNRMHAIQNALQKTHTLTYQYEFVWENWKRKETLS